MTTINSMQSLEQQTGQPGDGPVRTAMGIVGSTFALGVVVMAAFAVIVTGAVTTLSLAYVWQAL